MTRQIATTFSDVRELICNRQFPDALRQLKSLDYSKLSGGELGEFYLLQSEASLYVGDYLFVPIDDAIEIFRHGSNTLMFAKAKLLKGWLLSIDGHYAEATESLMESYTSYLRCNNWAMCAKSLYMLSDVQVHVGNMDSAIENAMKSVGIYTELGREKNRISVTQNLCCYYLLAGRLSESMSAYAGISSEIINISDRSLLIYYEMSAIPHALVGDFAKAKKIIAKCEPYLDKYARERGIYFENLGWINILSGNYNVAEKALTLGLKTAHELDSAPALVAQIKRLFGDLYIATEKYDLAHQFVTEALVVAEQTNKRPEIAACYRIFAQIDNHSGHDEKAREWFTKAIDIFSLIGSNYELAVTRYLAGISGLYHNGERTALLYLAKEYFESESVKPYIKKINAEFSKNKPLKHGPKKTVNLNGRTIIARSPVMKKLIEKARNIAESDMTILLTGETGTGKNLLARYIHDFSCKPGEFITVECTGIPEALLESELFGYEKGAFTGANSPKQGRFELAQGGTLFLDEIGDIPGSIQVKLLRALEDRKIMRLGSVKEIPLDIRIIAATNRDLQQRMKENLFRSDLYYRLNNILIDLPPLSERLDDIPMMVEHFLTNSGNGFKVNGNGEEIKRLGVLLSVPDYNGNVRELKNRVAKLLFMSNGDVDRMIEAVLNDGLLSECEWLQRILKRTDWNRSETARTLGVSEGTVRRRIAKHRIFTNQ